MQMWIHNKNLLTACNTEITLMKGCKHYSAFEKKLSENAVPDSGSKIKNNKLIVLATVSPCY